MRAALLSIKPIHCMNILNLLKTYEIRKTRLPLNTPIFLYVTKTKRRNEIFDDLPKSVFKGKVVAKIEFDSIKGIEFEYERYNGNVDGYYVSNQMLDDSCIDEAELFDYGRYKPLFFHHISKVEIIEPKEIGEFKHWKTKTIYSGMDCPPYSDDVLVPLTKAPQSYCYVEVNE